MGHNNSKVKRELVNKYPSYWEVKRELFNKCLDFTRNDSFRNEETSNTFEVIDSIYIELLNNCSYSVSIFYLYVHEKEALT